MHLTSLIFLFFLIGCPPAPQNNPTFKQICPFFPKSFAWSNIQKDPHAFIAHAGGGINEATYTNSKDAVLNSIENGFQLIELDLQVLNESEIVAAHDWKHFSQITHSQPGYIPASLQEFKKKKIHKVYGTLTYTEVIEILKKNPSTYLVTDKIKKIGLLTQNNPFINRLLVEVFSIEDYIKALQSGIKYPILSIEASGNEVALDYALSNKVPIIALHSLNIEQFKDKLEEIVQQGTCVYAFSSNDEKFIKKNIGKYITGVYTDFWSPRDKKCTSKNGIKCITY